MHIHQDLAVIDEFYQIASRFSFIEGFLDPAEGYLLYRIAAEGPGLGAIVEIGSYCGRSTAFLAAGSRAARREKVIAVDHFQGSPEHQEGARAASEVLAKEGTTFGRFCENLAQVQLFDHVQPVKASSREAAANWSGPVRVLFIDGEHSYESARQDFDCWTPFVVPGGVVALHDVGVHAGVTQLFEEVSAIKPQYRPLLGIASLRVLQKL